MTIKYGFLNYDEPKKVDETEVPKKTFEFTVKDSSDVRSAATALSDDVYENLAGKTKFRFYIENGLGSSSVYQVDFTKETRDFFESELADDLKTLLEK
jgi:hypothetical protein